MLLVYFFFSGYLIIKAWILYVFPVHLHHHSHPAMVAGGGDLIPAILDA